HAQGAADAKRAQSHGPACDPLLVGGRRGPETEAVLGEVLSSLNERILYQASSLVNPHRVILATGPTAPDCLSEMEGSVCFLPDVPPRGPLDDARIPIMILVGLVMGLLGAMLLSRRAKHDGQEHALRQAPGQH